VFLLPGPDAPAPQETEASGYYARAIEALEHDRPGVSLAAMAALEHHLADLVGPGSYSPAGYLPDDSPAAADARPGRERALTTPRLKGRGFPGSRPGVPVSQRIARGVSRRA
jgi:hypothetical protein